MQEYPGYIVSTKMPSKNEVHHFTEALSFYLFPVTSDEDNFLKSHLQVQSALKDQLRQLILSAGGGDQYNDVIEDYFAGLSKIRDLLLKDAQLILDFDPAAGSVAEVVLSYPGFFAIMIHRLSHPLYKQGIPILPRMMSEWAHSKTGIDINPGATIGCPFFIDHGTGVVIGETAVIGNNVKVYQGVTLGAIAVRKEDARKKRHPSIEDNVVIYAGSTILGGDTVIGNDSIIGGNTWLTQSVPAFSVVYHKNQTVITDRKDVEQPLNFVI